MLIAIECVKFRIRRIDFHEGLNVVLGDNEATNSIGKSTLLMIIDFAFGGGSLLEYNKDVVSELGHHSYKFTFKFGEETHSFERFTDQPEVVFVSDDQGAQLAIPIAKYNALLKISYGIKSDDLSFRSLVGLFSRVWGKENLDVHRPLHVVKSQAARECIDVLIKTFDKYSPIRDLSVSLAAKEQERSALRSAFKNRLLPKIGKRQHGANEQTIQKVESEIQDIKNHLAQYAANINQLVDQRMLDLKVQRDDLLAVRTRLRSRLLRTRKNISENRHIKSRHFAALIEYFPEINTDRLAEVEEFHNGVAKLLRAELKEAETQLSAQLLGVDAQISATDERMSAALTSVAQPSEIIDRVYELSNTWNQARGENEYYERTESVSADLAKLADDLRIVKLEILALIQRQVNSHIAAIVARAFGEKRKSPTLLLSESSYEYEVFEDTGTGTAYSSLIMLDLAIFAETFLPCVSHDSVLFKNIETGAVAKLMDVYCSISKQSFIAIDEAKKYGDATEKLLNEHAVIKLSNSRVLFTKDWRSTGSN
jgi:uncharacterized protein YydD (DUF2326 family)